LAHGSATGAIDAQQSIGMKRKASPINYNLTSLTPRYQPNPAKFLPKLRTQPRMVRQRDRTVAYLARNFE
jgi:hypothetical protein